MKLKLSIVLFVFISSSLRQTRNFSAQMSEFADPGEGAIVMTNSDNAFELIQEVVRSIAKEYGWPDYPLN